MTSWEELSDIRKAPWKQQLCCEVLLWLPQPGTEYHTATQSSYPGGEEIKKKKRANLMGWHKSTIVVMKRKEKGIKNPKKEVLQLLTTHWVMPSPSPKDDSPNPSHLLHLSTEHNTLCHGTSLQPVWSVGSWPYFHGFLCISSLAEPDTEKPSVLALNN